MRNTHQYPVTLEEVNSMIKGVDLGGPDAPIGSIDPLALHLLKGFLDTPKVQKALGAYLEEVQPKSTDKGLDALTLSTIRNLFSYAYGRRPFTHIYSADYAGISTRGSYVYDLNKDNPHTKVRLYVRLDRMRLRGELDEDLFQDVPRIETLPELNALSDEPISGIGALLRDLRNLFPGRS